MESIRAFQRLLRPITTRIRRMVAGSIIRMVNDGDDIQKLQIQTIGRKVYDNVEKFGVFGISSNPPTGLDAIIVERGGKYIVVAIGDRKYRIKNLESGDTVVYDIRGQIVRLDKNGIKINDVNGNSTVMTDAGITTTDKNNNQIIMSTGGITVTDKNSNQAVLSATGINLTDKNGNNIIMGPAGINLNGVLITQAGIVTAPASITAAGGIAAGGAAPAPGNITTSGAITAGGDITSGTGKTLDTHTHQIAQTTAISGASTSGPTSITATTTPAI